MTNVSSSKLLPKFIGPFRVLRRQDNAYTVELPRSTRTYPTFYVGRLRPYCHYELSSSDEDSYHVQKPPSGSCAPAPGVQPGRAPKISLNLDEVFLRKLSPLTDEGANIALDLKLRDCVLSTVLRTLGLAILAVLPHSVGQSETTVPLMI